MSIALDCFKELNRNRNFALNQARELALNYLINNDEEAKRQALNYAREAQVYTSAIAIFKEHFPDV